MWAILLLLTTCVQVKGCSNSENYDVGNLAFNPGCEDRGMCIGGSCYCCGSKFECEEVGIVGYYTGSSCEQIRYYISMQFGFLIPDGSCPDNVPTLGDVSNLIPNYDGTFESRPCKDCERETCDEFESNAVDKEVATEGVLIKFRTFLNSHYNLGCPQSESEYACPENFDDGITAKELLEAALLDKNIFKNVSLALGYPEDNVKRLYFKDQFTDDTGSTRTRRPTARPSPLPTRQPTPSPTTMPSPNPTPSPTTIPTQAPTPSPTPMPTQAPTPSPTPMPTPQPTQSPTPMPTPQPTPSPTLMPTPAPTPMPTPAPTSSPTPMPTQAPTPSPTPMPTQAPTQAPTPSPTQLPTKVLLKNPECIPYGNNVKDFRFVDYGVGASCRGNISESWPGGRTCDSPYIICLPQENTPAYYNHKTNTHRYTVLQCQQECALDQRCRGFEFVADTNSSLGDCNLIDDIEVQVVDQSTSTTFDYIFALSDTYSNLDSSETGGDALCFEKLPEICNPYFKELNETILDCYCPNDRKGFYTKKVKRTVENTRYCGNDASMDERIKLAQANRMFHLCENWCLFNILNPEQESWYWDPWNTCWYETYSGVGAHRAYCDRVIRNPNSIELQFVNRRAENFISCGKTKIPPTESPVEDVNVTYYLSDPAGSCDEACSGKGLTCAADQTARVFSSETDLIAAFKEAGFTCQSDNIIMNRTNWEGWALPGLGYGRICANRLPTLSHLEDLDSDCNRKIGKGWNRLCACY